MQKSEIFKTIQYMGGNIQNIYAQIIRAEEENNIPLKIKALRNLSLARQYEEKLYQQLSYEDIGIALDRYSFLPETNSIKNTKEISSLDMPLYRDYIHLGYLHDVDQKSYKVEDLIDNEDYTTIYVNEKELIEEEQRHYFVQTLLTIKFTLTYLNLLKRRASTKESATKEYYNVIYLNRLLEEKWLPLKFKPFRIDQIEDFMKMNWQTKILLWDREFFGELAIDSMERYITEIMTDPTSDILTDSEYLYEITNYFSLTDDQKTEFLKEIDELLIDPTMTKEKEALITKYLNGLLAINAKNGKKRKRSL